MAESHIARDVKITISPFVDVNSWSRGYLEYRIELTNRSSSNRRNVSIAVPGQLDAGPLVTSSFAIDPLSTMVHRFYLPSLSKWEGRNIVVSVDGKDVSIKTALPEFVPAAMGSSKNILILTSMSVNAIWADEIRGSLRKYKSSNITFKRSMYRIRQWSDNWLAYSACNVVIITGKDVRQMSQLVADALSCYVNMGGKLIITNIKSMPEKIFGHRAAHAQGRRLKFGLGQCLILTNSKSRPPVKFITNTRNVHAMRSAQSELPFVPKRINKTMTMLIILSVYVLVMVVAIFVFWKLRRRPMLVWILPVTSLLACIAIISCIAMSESFVDRYRIGSITFLDQQQGQASSFGLLGVYCPINSKELTFSRETAMEYLGDNNLAVGCYVHWNHSQTLWGFMESRKPGYFSLCKSSSSHKGLEVEYKDNNPFSVFNALGGHIKILMLRSKSGFYFVAEDIAPGQQVELRPIETVPGQVSMVQNSLFKILGRYWPALWHCQGYSDYTAVMTDSPFLSVGLRDAENIDSMSLICGKLEIKE